MRRRRSGGRNAGPCPKPHKIAKGEEPQNAREGANHQRWTPPPALAHEEQQEIGEVELFFDGQRPEDSVNAETSVRIRL